MAFEVVFFPVQSNAAQIEAMRAGRLHVAGFDTGSNPLAVNCAGLDPFAMMAAEGGSFGYERDYDAAAVANSVLGRMALSHDRLRPRLQSAAGPRGEGQRGVLHLPLEGVGAREGKTGTSSGRSTRPTA